MKYCPSCQRTYGDEQNFCLQDGAPLAIAEAPSSPNQDFVNNSAQYGGSTPPPQQGYTPTPPGLNAPGAGMPPPAWQAAPPPRKRKIWPWVLGGVAVLGIGFVALAGIIGYVAYKAANKDTSGVVVNTANMKTYVNSRANFTGKLAEQYADFSFNYPQSWELDEKAGKGASPNFVKVENSMTEDGREYTLENFAVGWFSSTGTMAGDRTIFPQLVNQLSSQFSQGFPEYEKVSEGETKVGSYSGYEFRFKSLARNTPKGDVAFWGRAILIPGGSATQRNGVALIMLASSLAPGLKSVDDIGVKGELPVILKSFRLGSSTRAGNTSNTSSRLNNSTGEMPADDAVVLQQLRQIEQEWAEANIKGDKEAITRILAAEYRGTDTAGTVTQKADYIETLTPSDTVKSQSFRNLDVELSGETAVLTGLTDVKFKNGETGTFTFTDTFKWRDGGWQAVSSHASPVQ